MDVPLNLILEQIVARKKVELAEARVGETVLERRAQTVERRDFAGVLRARRPAILAEIKKASPSRGVLSTNFDAALIAAQYRNGGAAAISVLTDRDFFQGSLKDLESVRAAVDLPILRKDFTIDEYQVLEAAASGADAILLIAAVLDEWQMRDLREAAGRYGMAALVEVHDARELAAAVASGAEVIGVNNRDLRTFEVRLETSLDLVDKIPSRTLKISESGIRTADDVKRLSDAGFDAFLVGEHLMRSANPTAAIRELVGVR